MFVQDSWFFMKERKECRELNNEKNVNPLSRLVYSIIDRCNTQIVRLVID